MSTQALLRLMFRDSEINRCLGSGLWTFGGMLRSGRGWKIVRALLFTPFEKCNLLHSLSSALVESESSKDAMD